jgi:hypothetical protein
MLSVLWCAARRVPRIAFRPNKDPPRVAAAPNRQRENANASSPSAKRFEADASRANLIRDGS